MGFFFYRKRCTTNQNNDPYRCVRRYKTLYLNKKRMKNLNAIGLDAKKSKHAGVE